jgi:hypothetical protein
MTPLRMPTQGGAQCTIRTGPESKREARAAARVSHNWLKGRFLTSYIIYTHAVLARAAVAAAVCEINNLFRATPPLRRALSSYCSHVSALFTNVLTDGSGVSACSCSSLLLQPLLLLLLLLLLLFFFPDPCSSSAFSLSCSSRSSSAPTALLLPPLLLLDAR